MTNPEAVDRLLNESRRLEDDGQDDENLALLSRALYQYPGVPEIRLALALALSDRDPEEGSRQAHRAAELSVDAPLTQLRCAYFFFNTGEFAAARDLAMRIKASTPPTWEFVLQLIHLGGRIAAQFGKLKLAEELLGCAFEGEPEYGGHGWYLAGLYLEQGRFSEALNTVTQALRHRPDDPTLKALQKEIVQVA